MWVGIKCTLLETELTMVITISYSDDFRSLTIKSILIVFYLVFGIASGVNSPSGKY